MNYNEWIKDSILAIDIVDNKIIDRSYNQYDIIANNTEIKENGFNDGIPSIVFHTNKRSHLRIKYDDDFSTLSNNMSLDFYFKLYSIKNGQDLYQRGPYVSSSLSYRLSLEEKRIVLEINYDGTYVFNYNVEDLELNRWYYLALERDNTGIFYLYLDGKLLDKNENYKNTVIEKREGCDLFIGCEDIENIDLNFDGELALYRLSNISRWNGIPPLPEIPSSICYTDERTIATFTGELTNTLEANFDGPSINDLPCHWELEGYKNLGPYSIDVEIYATGSADDDLYVFSGDDPYNPEKIFFNYRGVGQTHRFSNTKLCMIPANTIFSIYLTDTARVNVYWHGTITIKNLENNINLNTLINKMYYKNTCVFYLYKSFNNFIDAELIASYNYNDELPTNFIPEINCNYKITVKCENCDPIIDPEPIYPSEIFQIQINKNLNDGNSFSSIEEISAYLTNIKTNIFPEMIIFDDFSASVLLDDTYKETFNNYIKIPDECNPSGYYKFFGKRISTYTYDLNTCDVIKKPMPNAEAFIGLYLPENECEILYEDVSNFTRTYQYIEYITLSNNISDISSVKNKFSNWLGINISDIKPDTNDDLYYFASTWNINNVPECPCFDCILPDCISANTTLITLSGDMLTDTIDFSQYVSGLTELYCNNCKWEITEEFDDSKLYYLGMLGEGKYKYAEWRDWDSPLYTNGIYDYNGPTYKVDGHYTLTKQWIDGKAYEVCVEVSGNNGNIDGHYIGWKRELSENEYVSQKANTSQYNLDYYYYNNGPNIYWILFNDLTKKDAVYYKNPGYKPNISNLVKINVKTYDNIILPEYLTEFNDRIMLFSETYLRFLNTNIKEYEMSSYIKPDINVEPTYTYGGPYIYEHDNKYNISLYVSCIEFQFMTKLYWNSSINKWIFECQYISINKSYQYYTSEDKSTFNNDTANITIEWIINNATRYDNMNYINAKYVYRFLGENTDSPIDVKTWEADNTWDQEHENNTYVLLYNAIDKYGTYTDLINIELNTI